MDKEYLNFLMVLNDLLKNIGTEQTILPKEIYEILASKVENKSEKDVVNSLLLQLQKINVQMEKMDWLNKHYRILHEFAQICSTTLNEDILLEKTYEMVSQVMSTDSFFLALYNEGDMFLDLVFMVEDGKVFPKQKIAFGNNYTSKVIRTREIIHEKQSSENMEFNELIGDFATSTCLFVPVIVDDHVKGVISVQSMEDFAYRKEHEELLQIIGAQVINSIESLRLYEKIYIMSQTDELTGLKNHRAFHEDLTKLMLIENQKLILVMIDSDHLKKVNDNYGHDIGDQYLKVLSDGIKHISTDHIEGYRYAGDEFMVIIKSISDITIAALHEQLVEYYSQHPINTVHSQLFVSISTGVAYYPIHGSTVDSLKKAADNALYMAKKQGGNGLVVTG